ncbi:MAG: SusD/RagB family nutrient-binding outer membrane lipoprotein [Ferruginibacter sp.]|nr:SusD/RagB family nutrient-binding outer membrane lipoprotein [Ferruginibacter sp.]
MINNNKLKTILLVACIGLTVTGCKKTWLDINTNPNSLPPTRPDFEFTAAIGRNAAVLGANEIGSYWSAQMTQSSTYAYSAPNFSYSFNNTNFNFWDGWYDILEDLEYAITKADENGLPAIKGPAKIIKAHIFQELVDVYGNIPFTDALKGSGSLAPKFDDQKTVYEGLITLLDQAIADIKANPFDVVSSAADVIFKGGTGGTTSWIRLANSLKLRILIRQSRITGRDAYITTEINKAAATSEGFLAAGQDAGANPGYTAASGQTNPFYDNWGYDANAATRALGRFPRPTTYLFNLMKATNDTFRLKRLFYTSGGESTTVPGVSALPEIIANYVAIPYGSASGFLAQVTSPIGPALIKRGTVNNPMYLMTAAESFLLLAEAKQRYPTLTLSGTAQTYYEQGVKESFRVTGTAASAATTLLTSGKDLADWTASPDKLKAIWQQKWLALVHYGGLEAWSEFRRTNYPVIPLSVSAPVGQKLPLRLLYPSTEVGSNGENIKSQGPVDVFSTRIFWDVD